MSELETTIDDRFPAYRSALFELLAQPSISATGDGMEQCAELLLSMLDGYPFDRVERIETSRYSLVYAERTVDESAPTVAFYGHYDVQPPGERDEWESPAFEPTVRDGSIYARGAGDNKGQFLAHAFALDALTGADADPAVNVKLLVEGGEESGSLGLIEYLRGEPTELADADLVYVADGPMHASRRPTIIYGNRGIVSYQLDLETANSDLHSGNFGGPTPNAANELVEVLSSMFDGDEVTVDGFSEDVEISAADRELVGTIPVDEDALKSELGIDEFATDDPYYERLLLRPTMTVSGLSSGYQGEGKKTIVPHRATAKLDSRLVPNQDPERVLQRITEHVERENPNVEVTKMGSFPPMKTPLDTPASTPLAAALGTVWDEDPVEMPLLGGSLPAAYFRSELDVPVLVVPYANPDQGNHSPNEHLDVDCFRNGIETTARFLERVPTEL
ncbi:M20/M25/M40 family metallo-hydrolase [Halorarum salinum]|uniref:M20/M25/M40 family metallo-hydrolase n=1 Tax=Halorarum salinum TaxID=2743089 RepID=A0A7D5L904_9EURY|nr:M20/M25/M40 family metallo-hydrolase [Halobaculum salinum]QLG61033.1 M20/M25/M40 family metallo-hydrolase [Halobaculum salinum]